MSPPAFERADPIALHVRGHKNVAPLGRGADGAARRPYLFWWSPYPFVQIREIRVSGFEVCQRPPAEPKT